MKHLLSLVLMAAMGTWSVLYYAESMKLPQEDERITVKILFYVFVVFFVLELIRQIRGLLKSDDLHKVKVTLTGWLKSKMFALLVATAALIALARPLGFFVSSAIYMGFLIFRLGGRKPLQYALVPCVVTVLAYLLFSVALSVPFPNNSLLF